MTLCNKFIFRILRLAKRNHIKTGTICKQSSRLWAVGILQEKESATTKIHIYEMCTTTFCDFRHFPLQGCTQELVRVYQTATVLVGIFHFEVSTPRLHFSRQEVSPNDSPSCKQVLGKRREPTWDTPTNSLGTQPAFLYLCLAKFQISFLFLCRLS